MELNSIKNRVLNREPISREEADFLADYPDLNLLCDAANEISRKFTGRHVDSCSIINARSGMCGEDCKWCAQASRYKTGCKTYNFVDRDEVMKQAHHNEKAGVQRFSLVASGRAITGSDLTTFCDIYKQLSRETNLYLCASMGLLNYDELMELKNSGVKRYHCNMETSSKIFPTLCTTHTPEEKKATIRAARQAGMEVCSGGIIGMGETMADRIDFAFELAELGVDSVPINILSPVKGTPLEDTPLISEEDIIRTVAIWRFILPTQTLRFAGGRLRLSRESMIRLLNGGINGSLVGDMLTTVSNDIESDRKLFHDAGIEF